MHGMYNIQHTYECGWLLRKLAMCVSIANMMVAATCLEFPGMQHTPLVSVRGSYMS